MQIKRIVSGPIAVNIYVIINQGQCIIIDPGGDYNKIIQAVGDNEVKAVLLTHGHFDHIGAVADFNNVDIYVHHKDSNMLNKQKLLAKRYGINLKDINANKLIYDDCILNIAGLSIQVICTPGHSEGSIVYIIENNMFSGDTLFLESYGRTDLEGGSMNAIIDSIKNKLFSLSGDYKVYPGHEDMTTLSHEREYNPINYD